LGMKAFLYIQKNKKLLLILIAALVLLSVIGLYFYYTASSRHKPQQSSKARSPYLVIIDGLRVNCLNNGKPALLIFADRFTIEKTKIGVFTFGLTNTARMHNAQIQIFSSKAAGSKKAGYTDFKDSLSDKTISAGFPVRTSNIASFEIQPIKVSFLIGNTLVSEISAQSASLQMATKTFVFTGTVRATSGSSTLETDELSFFPAQGLLRTEKNYTLKRPSNPPLQGKGISVNIYLKQSK
jgi:hypothetical protein